MSGDHDLAERAAAMAERLRRTVAGLGWAGAGARSVESAFAAAIEPRLAALQPRDPRFLHPGRTALILLEDARVREPPVVAAGCVTETVDVALRVAPAEVRRRAGEDVARIVAEVPGAEGPGAVEAADALLEALVTAEREVRLVALAERLDHARHLHLRRTEDWPEMHRVTEAVYLPVAERTDPVLFRRMRWWCGMFRRRYL